MKFTGDYFSSVSIWIKSHDLSLEMWNKDTIRRISSTLVNLIRMDTNTTKETRLNYARILLKIDVNF